MSLVDEVVGRLQRWASEDDAFEVKFGSWRRPEHLPRYNLRRFVMRIEIREELLQLESFLRSFPEHERDLLKEVCAWVYEHLVRLNGKPLAAGDKTLTTYRLQLGRLLRHLGY